MLLQLYLHFPFCKRKCAYCDFCSCEGTALEMEAYAEMLAQEIRLAAPAYSDATISTIFLGGGTPSVMSEKAMDLIWRTLRDSFSFVPDMECTVEANPGTLTARWLELGQYYGINRLSLGVQAAQDRHLKTLGRIHTFAEAKDASALAQRMGIENINVDIMFGLPGQRGEEYLETLSAVAALSPSHVSAYSLILEQGTPLWAMVEQGACVLPTEDETAEMYEQGVKWLAGQGYRQYEISNFAREGYECRHNLGYWQGAWYLGLGLNAHSMLPANEEEQAYLRAENTADMKMYRRMLEGGQLPTRLVTPVSPKEAMFETMMLGLRTTAGVGEEAFCRRHGQSMRAVYGEKLDRLVEESLGIWREEQGGGSAFALTAKGLLLQNAVLLQLM